MRYAIHALIIGLLILTSCSKSTVRKPSSVEMDKKIILGIDGLGYDSFLYAKEKLGLFKRFNNIGAHVSTFPSISDYVWNTMVQAQKVFGEKGRLKNFETAYFDEFSQKLDEDPRNYLIASANPYRYLRAFPMQYNVYKEVVGYQSATVLLDGEIPSVEQQIKASNAPVVSGFIVGFDSIAHVHKGYYDRVLTEIDASIERMVKHFEEQGESVEVILLADHDLSGHFDRGGEEYSLTSVDVQGSLKKAGFSPVTQFSKSNQYEAMPVILALASYVPVYFKDHAKVERYVKSIVNEKWLQVAAYKKHIADLNQASEYFKRYVHLMVTNKLGTGEVLYDKQLQLYRYNTITGNPLEQEGDIINQWLDADTLFERTVQHKYPDAIFRLIQSADNSEVDYPDLILSFNNGYMTKGSLEGMVTMLRTHGNISEEVAFGLVASSNDLRAVPRYVRTKKILSAIGMDPQDLFQLGGFLEHRHDFSSDRLKGFNFFKARKLRTGVDIVTSQRTADRFTKVVEHTKYIFDVNKYSDIVKLDDSTPGKYQLVLNLENISGDKSFLSGDYQDRISQATEKGLEKEKGKWSSFWAPVVSYVKDKQYRMMMDIRQLFQGTKAVITATYSTPSLVRKFYYSPKEVEVKDPRDYNFAKAWREMSPESYAKNVADQSRLPAQSFFVDPDTSKQLFQSVFEEQKVVERMSPQKIDLYYGAMPSTDVTVVYVSGIYDTVFDGTIFRPAMDRLVQLLGVRVIKSDVISTCSPNINGKRLMAQLKDDYQQRILRGFNPPQYVLLGYSKGGLDSLSAFSEDPQFVRDHIKALVTIASPLRGAPIAETYDLPRIAIDSMSMEVTPKVCRSTERALDSLTPKAVGKFWNEKKAMLEGLTQYYSISFVEGAGKSHPWMQITKLLAFYSEDNDGVVPLSSSRFPEGFSATDLGIINADHLAGTVSSDFEQTAFAKAILISLAEMQVIPHYYMPFPGMSL